jgi:hypothetical protein
MNTEQLALLAILIVSFALSLHASEGFKAYVAQFDPSYGDTIKYIPLSLRNATFDSAANCICDALPNVSGLSLFWAFRLSRRDIRILVVRDGILLSSLAAFVSSFTIYLATFILGLGVCAYISTPKHLWSLNVVKTCVSRVQCSPSTETFNFPGIPVFTLSPLMFWFIFILLRNIWVLSSVFNTRRNWISLCSAISKRCEDWNLPELLWWPFISSQEIAEFLTPGDTRNWICSSHGRSVYDALAISCKTSGCDRKRRRYWYIYTIESTTLPATIPYESIPIVSAPHRFKFAPFLVGFYPGLRIEMLLKTMYIASFIEISNPLVDPKQLFISSTDAYLNDTSGYTLVERGKLPRDQLESFKSYFSKSFSIILI